MKGRRVADLARSPTAGAAYVEMILTFPTLFLLFMCLCQIAMLSSARMVVADAADRAARTAAVVHDDEPRGYGGEPRGELGGSPLTAGDLDAYLALSSGAAGELPTLSRRASIELAAAMALAPLLTESGGESLGSVLATPTDASTTLDRMAIEIADHSESPRLALSVRAPCAVPLARQLVCGGADRLIRVEVPVVFHDAPYPYRDE